MVTELRRHAKQDPGLRVRLLAVLTLAGLAAVTLA